MKIATITAESRQEAHGRYTIRQIKFITCYVQNGGNASKAALQAGYAHRQRGWELVSNRVIWQQIEARFNYYSAYAAVIKTLARHLETKKIVFLPLNCEVHDSLRMRVKAIGRKKMAIEVPDGILQLKAADLAAKILGFYNVQTSEKSRSGHFMDTKIGPTIFNHQGMNKLEQKSVE